jgi:hypothetical protein
MSELNLPPRGKPRADWTDDEASSMVVVVIDAIVKALDLKNEDFPDGVMFADLVREAIKQDVSLPDDVWKALANRGRLSFH